MTAGIADHSGATRAAVAELGKPHRWIISYVAEDRFYCGHEAESADVIREHARLGGFPASRVTEVGAVIGPETARQGLIGRRGGHRRCRE